MPFKDEDFWPDFEIPEIPTYMIHAGHWIMLADRSLRLRDYRLRKAVVYGEKALPLDELCAKDPFIEKLQSRNWSFALPPGSMAAGVAVPLDGSPQRITPNELYHRGYLTIRTGLEAWPFIVVDRDLPIVISEPPEQIVGEIGEAWVKLGY